MNCLAMHEESTSGRKVDVLMMMFRMELFLHTFWIVRIPPGLRYATLCNDNRMMIIILLPSLTVHDLEFYYF